MRPARLLTPHVAPSKFILTAELDPKDEGNFEKWYREEHLDMIHQVPGHRRSQRYVIGPKVAVMGDVTEAPKYLAIHEFDNIDAYKNKTPEASAPRETPWSKKQLSDSQHLYAARMFELIMPMGF